MTKEEIIKILEENFKAADENAIKATEDTDTLMTGYYEGKAEAFLYAIHLLRRDVEYE